MSDAATIATLGIEVRTKGVQAAKNELQSLSDAAKVASDKISGVGKAANAASNQLNGVLKNTTSEFDKVGDAAKAVSDKFNFSSALKSLPSVYFYLSSFDKQIVQTTAISTVLAKSLVETLSMFPRVGKYVSSGKTVLTALEEDVLDLDKALNRMQSFESISTISTELGRYVGQVKNKFLQDVANANGDIGALSQSVSELKRIFPELHFGGFANFENGVNDSLMALEVFQAKIRATISETNDKIVKQSKIFSEETQKNVNNKLLDFENFAEYQKYISERNYSNYLSEYIAEQRYFPAEFSNQAKYVAENVESSARTWISLYRKLLDELNKPDLEPIDAWETEKNLKILENGILATQKVKGISQEYITLIDNFKERYINSAQSLSRTDKQQTGQRLQIYDDYYAKRTSLNDRFVGVEKAAQDASAKAAQEGYDERQDLQAGFYVESEARLGSWHIAQMTSENMQSNDLQKAHKQADEAQRDQTQGQYDALQGMSRDHNKNLLQQEAEVRQDRRTTWEKMLDDWTDTNKQMEALSEQSLQDIQSGFKDFWKESFEEGELAWDSLWDAFKNIAYNAMAQVATTYSLKFLSSLFSGNLGITEDSYAASTWGSGGEFAGLFGDISSSKSSSNYNLLGGALGTLAGSTAASSMFGNNSSVSTGSALGGMAGGLAASSASAAIIETLGIAAATNPYAAPIIIGLGALLGAIGGGGIGSLFNGGSDTVSEQQQEEAGLADDFNAWLQGAGSGYVSGSSWSEALKDIHKITQPSGGVEWEDLIDEWTQRQQSGDLDWWAQHPYVAGSEGVQTEEDQRNTMFRWYLRNIGGTGNGDLTESGDAWATEMWESWGQSMRDQAGDALSSLYITFQEKIDVGPFKDLGHELAQSMLEGVTSADDVYYVSELMDEFADISDAFNADYGEAGRGLVERLFGDVSDAEQMAKVLDEFEEFADVAAEFANVFGERGASWLSTLFDEIENADQLDAYTQSIKDLTSAGSALIDIFGDEFGNVLAKMFQNVTNADQLAVLSSQLQDFSDAAANLVNGADFFNLGDDFLNLDLASQDLDAWRDYVSQQLADNPPSALVKLGWDADIESGLNLLETSQNAYERTLNNALNYNNMSADEQANTVAQLIQYGGDVATFQAQQDRMEELDQLIREESAKGMDANAASIETWVKEYSSLADSLGIESESEKMVTSLQSVVDILGAIAQAFGVTLPEAATTAAQKTSDALTDIGLDESIIQSLGLDDLTETLGSLGIDDSVIEYLGLDGLAEKLAEVDVNSLVFESLDLGNLGNLVQTLGLDQEILSAMNVDELRQKLSEQGLDEGILDALNLQGILDALKELKPGEELQELSSFFTGDLPESVTNSINKVNSLLAEIAKIQDKTVTITVVEQNATSDVLATQHSGGAIFHAGGFIGQALAQGLITAHGGMYLGNTQPKSWERDIRAMVGEWVINKQAVDYYGSSLFAGLNSMAVPKDMLESPLAASLAALQPSSLSGATAPETSGGEAAPASNSTNITFSPNIVVSGDVADPKAKARELADELFKEFKKRIKRGESFTDQSAGVI